MTTGLSMATNQSAPAIAEASEGRLRVAYLVSTFEAGGLERCVAHLVNRLDRRRFDPLVISLSKTGPAADWITRDDVPIRAIGKQPGNDLRAVGRLAELLKAERVDVVHSHNWGTLLETVVARRRAGVPVHVHAEHGQELDVLHASRIKRRLREMAIKWGFRRVNVVVACARSVQERVERLSGSYAARTRFIPNGVALDESCGDSAGLLNGTRESVSRSLRGLLRIPAGATVLGTLSRLAAVKDFPTAIRALAVLVARGRDVHLVLVGDGVEHNHLGMIADQERATERVHFVGRQSNVAAWLKMFDIYVNSSLSEAMCLGILESMSAGVSIVATDVGDTAELICGENPCGLTVPASDPLALADAVDSLLGDQPLREQLGKNGVQRHAARYSVDRMVADYSNLYLELSRQNR